MNPITALKQAREALQLAQSSHGAQLTSLPPQDAWIARGVPGRIATTIASIDASLSQFRAALATQAVAPVAEPDEHIVTQLAKHFFAERWDEAALRKGTDQAVTPAFMEWLQTMARREGVAANEAWNAGVAWATANATPVAPVAEAQRLAEEARTRAFKYAERFHDFQNHASPETMHDLQVFKSALDAAIDRLAALAAPQQSEAVADARESDQP